MSLPPPSANVHPHVCREPTRPSAAPPRATPRGRAAAAALRTSPHRRVLPLGLGHAGLRGPRGAARNAACARKVFLVDPRMGMDQNSAKTARNWSVLHKKRGAVCVKTSAKSKNPADCLVRVSSLGPPARCPFSPLGGWEGSPSKIDSKKIGYSYSNLSTGGPRKT